MNDAAGFGVLDGSSKPQQVLVLNDNSSESILSSCPSIDNLRAQLTHVSARNAQVNNLGFKAVD